MHSDRPRSGRERKLRKVAVSGGPAQTICDIPVGFGILGASWGAGDTIVFAQPGVTDGLFRVSALGGQPERLTTPDVQNGEREHRWPEMLPGDRAVVFTSIPSADIRQARIALLNLETKDRRILVEGGSSPHYAPTGHLLYGHLGTLMAVPFDANRLEVVGIPVPVQERIITKAVGAANYGISASGMLIYVPGGAGGDRARPVWVARDGRELPPVVDVDLESPQFPRLSPDGRRLVLTLLGDLWV